jgi:hypothetical protein
MFRAGGFAADRRASGGAGRLERVGLSREEAGSAMIYEVRLAEGERDLLRGLRGTPIESIWRDGWSSFICLPAESIVQIVPDEVPTPGPFHPYADVNRPRVIRGEHEPLGGAELVARALGRVRSIAVLEVQLMFSPPRHAPSSEVLGVAIPEGVEYGPVFLGGPACSTPAIDDLAPLVRLDIAFELSTDLDHTVTFYTDAVGHVVRVAVDGRLPAQFAGLVRRVALDADL